MTWSALPRASRRATSSRTSSCASPAESSPSTSWMRSASTGVSEAKSRASATSMSSGMGDVSRVRFGFVGDGAQGKLGRRLIVGTGLDHDVAEELGLMHARLAEPYQLEQREESDHPLRAQALGPGDRGEEERPRVAQELDDLAHALEHGQRIGLDLARSLTLLLLDETGHGALEEMDGQILQGHVLGRRQLGHRAPVQERLLGFALSEPCAEGLHPRVLAETLGQLLAHELPFLVEDVRRRVRIHGKEELGLEVDESGRHHHERAGRLQVLEPHRLEMREVLLGDGAHGQIGEIDFIGAAEVQEEVERPHEGLDTDGEAVRLGVGDERRSGHGSRFTTARTSPMVFWAKARACCEPAWRISTISRGRAAKRSRRSRISARGGSMCFRSTPLQSRQPMPAVRHPVAQASRSGAGVKILCRSKTGHTSGLPGSLRRLRAGSVIIGLTFVVISSSVSESRMALFSDLDIFRPSVPGTLGISVSLAPGSGNTGFQVWLKRRATSRVSSTCGT